MICSRIMSRVTCYSSPVGCHPVSPLLSPRINLTLDAPPVDDDTRTTRPLGASVHPRTDEKSETRARDAASPRPPLTLLFVLLHPLEYTLSMRPSLPGAGAMGYVDIANTPPSPDLSCQGMQRVPALSGYFIISFIS